jgi:hypothetical protein
MGKNDEGNYDKRIIHGEGEMGKREATQKEVEQHSEK